MYDYGSKKKNEEHYGQVSSVNRQCVIIQCCLAVTS